MLFNLHLWSLLLGFALASACGIRAVVPILGVITCLASEQLDIPRNDLLATYTDAGSAMFFLICSIINIVAPHIYLTRQLAHMVRVPLMLVCATFVMMFFLTSLDAIPRITLSFTIGAGGAYLMYLSMLQIELSLPSWNFHVVQIARSVAAVVVVTCSVTFPVLSALGIVAIIVVGLVRLPSFMTRHF